MNKRQKNSAVLWTGGKDSSLALHEAKLSGVEVGSLVTFVPRNAEFLAHPIGFMKYQAEALELPHYTLEVGEPYQESYERAINSLGERYGIDTLITGDIAEVDGHPNWIRKCSENSGMNVITPLWGTDRNELISRLLSSGFEVIFSCVKKPWFSDEWVGMRLDEDSWQRLRQISVETNLDICGEQGEYHTLVLGGPPLKRSIHVAAYSKCEKDSLMYMDIQEVVLQEK